MSQKRSKLSKTLKWFNATGLIHTIISISVFVLSLVNYLYPEYYQLRSIIRILSTITLLNTLVWLLCANVLLFLAGKLNDPKAVAKARGILLLSIFFVLTPDILTVTLFWLPMLKDNLLINFVCFVSPVLVFLGWFIGKKMGKNIQSKVH